MDPVHGPCEVMCLILDRCNYHSGTMGLSVFGNQYSVRNNMSLKIFLCFYLLFIIMTFYTFYKVSNDFLATAFWFVTFGPLVQSVLKLYIFLGSRAKLLQLSRQSHETYQRNSHIHSRKEVLERFLNYSLMGYKTMKIFYFSSGFIISTVPIVLFLLGKRFLPFGIYLPMLDHTSSPGFELNYIIMVCLVYLTVNGLTASETFFVMHILLGMGHLKVMETMVDDLSEALQLKAATKEDRLAAKVEQIIKEIVYEHQDQLRFINLFEEIFSAHELVMVGSASLMILVCLVVLVKQFWLLGLLFCVLGIYQILFVCAIGTAYEASCTGFLDKLYLSHWYLLSPNQRKQWWLIMQIAQRPKLNTMGGMHPSNLNSFLIVLRALYSILMMLLSVSG